MSKKLIAAFLTAFVITVFILSFYLEPLHAIVEAVLIVSLLSMVSYMLYSLIYGILTVGEPKDKKDYYLQSVFKITFLVYFQKVSGIFFGEFFVYRGYIISIPPMHIIAEVILFYWPQTHLTQHRLFQGSYRRLFYWI